MIYPIGEKDQFSYHSYLSYSSSPSYLHSYPLIQTVINKRESLRRRNNWRWKSEKYVWGHIVKELIIIWRTYWGNDIYIQCETKNISYWYQCLYVFFTSFCNHFIILVQHSLVIYCTYSKKLIYFLRQWKLYQFYDL